MGNVQSTLGVSLDPANPRTRLIFIALMLLWRSKIGLAIKTARGAAAEPAPGTLTDLPTLLAHTGLIVTSHGTLWNQLRTALNITKPQQVALVLFILQLQGLIPELGHYLALANSIYAQSKEPVINDYVIPGLVTALSFLVFHEASDAYVPTWFGIFFKLMGAPSPVLGGAPGPQATLVEAFDPTALVAHVKSSFPFALKLFLAVHLGIRPLLAVIRARMAGSQGRVQTAATAINERENPRKPRHEAIIDYLKGALPQAARSAAFVTFAGLVNFAAGRWRVSDSPIVTCVVRAALAQIALGAAFLDDPELGRVPIYNFATAELLYALVGLLGRQLNTPEHLSPQRLIALLHPALSALGVCSPSLLGGLVSKAL